MLELNFEQCVMIGGGAHDYAEACLVGGSAGISIGSFFSPAGGAIGGLGGCAAGMFVHYMMR